MIRIDTICHISISNNCNFSRRRRCNVDCRRHARRSSRRRSCRHIVVSRRVRNISRTRRRRTRCHTVNHRRVLNIRRTRRRRTRRHTRRHISRLALYRFGYVLESRDALLLLVAEYVDQHAQELVRVLLTQRLELRRALGNLGVHEVRRDGRALAAPAVEKEDVHGARQLCLEAKRVAQEHGAQRARRQQALQRGVAVRGRARKRVSGGQSSKRT